MLVTLKNKDTSSLAYCKRMTFVIIWITSVIFVFGFAGLIPLHTWLVSESFRSRNYT